jgi:hypothetical protein
MLRRPSILSGNDVTGYAANALRSEQGIHNSGGAFRDIGKASWGLITLCRLGSWVALFFFTSRALD